MTTVYIQEERWQRNRTRQNAVIQKPADSTAWQIKDSW